MQSDVNKRRAERQRQIRRKRVKISFIFFILIAVITLAIMCFTVFFKIDNVEVAGSKIYKDQINETIKASGLIGENLFVVSEDKVEEKIRKKLPYVDDVSLKRKFPNKIELTITDAKERLYFENENKYFFVSDSGYILKEQFEVPENAFQIVTSGMSGNVGEIVIYQKPGEKILVEKLLGSLDKNHVYINKIDVTSALSITLEVENKFIVSLGKDEFIEEKIAHLASMIEAIGERSGKINLSMWSPQNSQGSFVENK